MKLNVKRLEEYDFEGEEVFEDFDTLEDIRGEAQNVVNREHRLRERERTQERTRGRKDKRQERRG